MKKNNFSEHFKKSTTHLNSVKGLSQPTETEAPPPGQKTIVACIRNQNKKLKGQLGMKFQLARFTAIHGEPFKLKQNIANFEKQIQEMLFYLSKSIVLENITKPLNHGMT